MSSIGPVLLRIEAKEGYPPLGTLLTDQTARTTLDHTIEMFESVQPLGSVHATQEERYQ
jgi:hypothetical protein